MHNETGNNHEQNEGHQAAEVSPYLTHGRLLCEKNVWVGQSIRNGQKESSVIAADKDEWTKPIDKHEQKEADVVSEFLNSEM